MRVLVACEFSGIVRDAFIRRGHDAMSCDLLPTETEGPHHQGNVLGILDGWWDLLIAHPPCTTMANSGVRWLSKKGSLDTTRHKQMQHACDLFAELYHAHTSHICIENPIMHKYARDYLQSAWKVPAYTQIIQPWQFGHGETKATCLWLKNLPLLQPTNIVDGREARIHKMGPSPERGKLRSLTYTGIADAMATQWG